MPRAARVSLLFSFVLFAWLSSVRSAAALTWHFETVDQGPGIGGYASIALGSAGDVHIAYFDGSHGIAKYARGENGLWQVETLDGQFLSGHYTSIKLNSLGLPCVAYRFYSGHNLRYAIRDGSWSHVDFETDPDMEADASLALDRQDRPHVAFWDGEFQGEPHDLGYASFDGTSWTTEIVDSPGDVGRNASLALDSQGLPHISYYDQTNNRLKYAHFDGSQWHTTTVDNVEVVAFNFRTSIAVDSHDRPHIIYSAYHYQAPDWYGRLKYATYDGSVWTTMVVDQSLPNRDFRVPSITLDALGRPHTSYLLYYNVEAITPDLKYAAFDGVSWQTEFVDTGDLLDSDFSNGIAVDAGGRFHIAYSRSGLLIHAWSDVPADVAHGSSAARPAVQLLPFANPVAGTVRFPFRLDHAGPARLEVYSVTGERVRTVAREFSGAGDYVLPIPGRLPPGVYLCRLTAGGESPSAKLVVR